MDPDHDDQDDLFDKLDQLISRHQARSQPPAPAPVPTLTEAVEQHPAVAQQEIPVLREAVESAAGEALMEWPATDRRRQLQVALYLRLRQRLDREFEALARGHAAAAGVDSAALPQLLQALRNALPRIIRESVDQALGSNGTKPD